VESKILDDRPPDADGWLSVVIGAAEAGEAIGMSSALAAQSGLAERGIAAAYEFSGQWAAGMGVTFSADALTQFQTAGVKALTVYSHVFQFSIDLAAIGSLQEQTDGIIDITVVLTPVAELSAEAAAVIGGRAVYEMRVYYEVQDEAYPIVDLGDGTMTWCIAYQPQRNENAANIKAVFVEDDGSPWVMQDSVYADGWVMWTDSCCSAVCGVGYKE